MKRIFTFAAMLLMSVCTFAQSGTPLKGDVNGDGKVDVADIVAVIEIILCFIDILHGLFTGFFQLSKILLIGSYIILFSNFLKFLSLNTQFIHHAVKSLCIKP